jgi:hypothetical protein
MLLLATQKGCANHQYPGEILGHKAVTILVFSKSNRFHVAIFWLLFYQFEVYSVDSHKVMG